MKLKTVRLNLDINIVLADYLATIGADGMHGNTLEDVAQILIVEGVQARVEKKELTRRLASHDGRKVVYQGGTP